jgi:hypothetical protein
MWHKAQAIVFGLILLVACSSSDADSDGGSGGFQPDPYDDVGPLPEISKLDLLLMIDNSASMADKQAILANGISYWINRLVEPPCVDSATGRTVGPSVDGACAMGELAFEPIKDIHLGVISSSLGGHGASVCNDAMDTRLEPHNDDRGHLVNRGAAGTSVPTFNGKAFLFYNPSTAGAGGTPDAVAIPFAEMIRGAGQHGCAYEASLESVYRFLVEPEPFNTIRIDTSIGGAGQALLNGTDMTLLQQRADFLRPDSLVAVLIATDENDCSITDGGQGFYPLLPVDARTGLSILKSGTSKCAENPNDPCCYPCGANVVPAGCPRSDNDPACTKGQLTAAEDHPNLRCFDQKRRYGMDFLFPVQRYIDGFTKEKVPNRRGEMVQNPLFADLTCPGGQPCFGRRYPSLVFVAGMVGVPWQDLSLDRGDLSKGYKTAKQLATDGAWADIVGDPLNPAGPVLPRDPHMIESMRPRNGLPGPDSSWKEDPKNGHEWDPTKDTLQPNADLQYACIFDLPEPTVCDQAGDCDCPGATVAETKSPLCQNEQGAYTKTQTRGKGYPGTRILQVLQKLGDQASVASICPAQSTDETRGDFGYRPAIDALLATVQRTLGHVVPWCSSSSARVDAKSQQIPCAIVEVFDAPACNCDTPGRRPARDELLTAEMKAAGSCRCEIVQLAGGPQSDCRMGMSGGAGSDGWCFVDPAQFGGAAACGAMPNCPASSPNGIRFNTRSSEPRLGATPFGRCHSNDVDPLPYFPRVCQ